MILRLLEEQCVRTQGYSDSDAEGERDSNLPSNEISYYNLFSQRKVSVC